MRIFRAWGRGRHHVVVVVYGGGKPDATTIFFTRIRRNCLSELRSSVARHIMYSNNTAAAAGAKIRTGPTPPYLPSPTGRRRRRPRVGFSSPRSRNRCNIASYTYTKCVYMFFFFFLATITAFLFLFSARAYRRGFSPSQSIYKNT